jgi:hypothetical protein
MARFCLPAEPLAIRNPLPSIFPMQINRPSDCADTNGMEIRNSFNFAVSRAYFTVAFDSAYVVRL